MVIVILEDEKRIRTLLTAMSHAFVRNVTVIETDRVDVAMEALQEHPSALLIADYRLGGGMNGIIAINRAKDLGWSGRSIVISGGGRPPEDLPADTRFMPKPFRMEELRSLLTETK
jgi:DNA-binding NtrC family response regulator